VVLWPFLSYGFFSLNIFIHIFIQSHVTNVYAITGNSQCMQYSDKNQHKKGFFKHYKIVRLCGLAVTSCNQTFVVATDAANSTQLARPLTACSQHITWTQLDNEREFIQRVVTNKSRKQCRRQLACEQPALRYICSELTEHRPS